ncbi:Alkylhydroperoxidase family enzyme, contains CxxC motif [Seinonella peptonophila]|uniref:Alkylhydroperoxidase family enzyme, contains CxxC motif n=1 Tax=Seinonella peptonophila TaxID=112248 RepID=A0A1M4X7L2_9BACL|nr:carboxymuconolactone decarboxylase family protein [Seinonella peptonophila]SHE89474.1 Alkylhydroperoxidase family enzyme, contains CxxC motif [Seinonella peptonophila]
MKDEMKSKMSDGTQVNAWQKKVAIKRPTKARIPLMDLSELSKNQRIAASIGASNVLRMLAHHSDLTEAWLEFGKHLTTSGRVSMRTRELLILRVALHSSCEYEWANHVIGALGAGWTNAEITSLVQVQVADSWSNADTAVLNLVDDLCADNCASETTWKALTATYDKEEIIELLMLIGFYRMNAGFLNSLGVQAEPGRPKLGQCISYEAPMPRQKPATNSSDQVRSAAKPDGTWHLKYYHPATTMELRLVIVAKEGVLSGSVFDMKTDANVPISEGKVHEHQVSFTTSMTEPYPITMTWEGMINNDFLEGTATITGGGSFPFDGKRVR